MMFQGKKNICNILTTRRKHGANSLHQTA